MPEPDKQTVEFWPYGHHWFAPHVRASGWMTSGSVQEGPNGEASLEAKFRPDENGWETLPSDHLGAAIALGIYKLWLRIRWAIVGKNQASA
ncbi:MAG: hypothetical protein ACC700_19850 [Anaerolineales bacterium]